MLAFADVLHFFAHKFSRLRRHRLSLPRVFARPFDCFFFWHNIQISSGVSFLDLAAPAWDVGPLAVRKPKP